MEGSVLVAFTKRAAQLSLGEKQLGSSARSWASSRFQGRHTFPARIWPHRARHKLFCC